MSLYNDCGYRSIYPGFELEIEVNTEIQENSASEESCTNEESAACEETTSDSAKLEIISELFEKKSIKFVKDEQKNLMLRTKLGKFSDESLKGLCQDLQLIFKNGYEDDKQRALIFEKFLVADESQWPFLIAKLENRVV